MNTTLFIEHIKLYLLLNWSLIPVDGYKKPLFNWKKYQNQQATEDEIKSWLNLYPECNIAVITGKSSNITVIDIDPRHGGDRSFLNEIHTPFSKTGGGGWHYFFQYQPNLTNKAGIFPGVDVRGDGGYAIIPPSKHELGNIYEWILSPFDTKFAPLPECFIGQLEPAISKGVANIAGGVLSGVRNSSAAIMAGSLLHQYPENKWESTCWPLLQAWNGTNKPPLQESELRTTFESIIQRAAETTQVSTKKSLASQIVESIISEKYILFHDQYRDGYISVSGTGSKVFKIISKSFQQWLSKYSWDNFHRSPYASINDACKTLEGCAVHGGKEYTLDTRVTNYSDAIWYDLGNGTNVRINKDGWSIVNDPPIIFRHLSHQKTQPNPESGGSVQDLCNLTNLKSHDDLLLFMVLTVLSFIPGFPHPIIILYGPQGSGKTTPMKMLKSLIDPSNLDVQTIPDNPREFAQQASHHWFMAYDNLSNMPGWLSDSLCRAVSGDGFSKRELYTNDDDIIYNFQRIIALNGINIVAEKADLLERSILLELERISKTSRKPETDIFTEFDSIKPWLLGAIFDTVSKTLRIVNSVHLESTPRMADFTIYGCAVSEALGYTANDFLRAYEANIKYQNNAAIEANNIALCVVFFMENKTHWQGRASDLLPLLNGIAEEHHILTIRNGWPKDPSRLSMRLLASQTNLQECGITVTREKSGARSITIEKNINNDVHTVQPTQQPLINEITDGKDGTKQNI